MENEVLLYGPIFAESSIDFINSINDVEGDDLSVRLNTVGGDVNHAWGMVAKFMEFDGSKVVKVDGAAYSMGFFFCVYSDTVEALDVSQFMVHRAAYSQWYEENYMTEDQRKNLETVNASLEKALRNKIDIKKFEEIKGVKIKDIFSMDGRVDVFLTSKEAKQIGLVDKIVNITPKKKKTITAEMGRIAAQFQPGYNIDQIVDHADGPGASEKLGVETKLKKMTLEQLKAEHPGIFAEAVKAGVSQEADRVGAWMKFVEVDAKAVSAGIEGGENLSQTAMADFSQKMFAASAAAKIENEGSAAPETPTASDEDVDADEKSDVQKFEDKMSAALELKND